MTRLVGVQRWTVQGAVGSTRESWTATSRGIFHQAIAGKFFDQLIDRVKKIKVGDGFEEDVIMGPVVDKAQFETDLRYIEIAKKEGCACLVGGEALTEGKLAKGYFLAPTVFDNVTPYGTLAQEEVFGPVLAVLRVSNFEEAMS